MKTPRFLFVVVAAAAFWTAACGRTPPTVEATMPPVELSPVVEPTSPPATLAPVEASAEASPVDPTATQPQYAPFCQAASTGCEAPTVTMLDNSYCVEKVPYAIMSVPAGTRYESNNLDFQCRDQMHSDGTMRVTCHSVTGKQQWSYDLRLCNSACNVRPLQLGTGQCEQGYGYDPVKMCCAAPPPANSDGCTVYSVDLGACPVAP